KRSGTGHRRVPRRVRLSLLPFSTSLAIPAAPTFLISGLLLKRALIFDVKALGRALEPCIPRRGVARHDRRHPLYCTSGSFLVEPLELAQWSPLGDIGPKLKSLQRRGIDRRRGWLHRRRRLRSIAAVSGLEGLS